MNNNSLPPHTKTPTPPTFDCTVYGYRRRQAVQRIRRALRILASHGDTQLDTESIEDIADMLEHRIDWLRERDGMERGGHDAN